MTRYALILTATVILVGCADTGYLTVNGQRVLISGKAVRVGEKPQAIAGKAGPVQTTNVDTSNPDDMALRRSPSITAQQIDNILQKYNSPATGSGKDFVELGQQYGIDPAYALAFFIHESSAGTTGVAVQTKNIGNIVCAGYATCIGRFRSYSTWREALEDWYKLLNTEYIPKGLDTVDKVVPVYAPAVENDVDAYVTSVETSVHEWRSQSTARHTITDQENIGARFYDRNCAVEIWGTLANCQHWGTDFLAPQGSNVYLPYAATFLDIGSYGPGPMEGQYVEFRLNDGCVFYAGHLQNVPTFDTDQFAESGTVIGQTNNKAHVHVQIKCNGELKDYEAYEKEH